MRPGWVVARADLLRALPGGGTDEHAVETAMARLRTALGAPRLIQTVVKRGYRLALDPVVAADGGVDDGVDDRADDGVDGGVGGGADGGPARS